MERKEVNLLPFDEDWTIGSLTITKNKRGYIAIFLWILTLILSIMTFILLAVVDSSKAPILYIAYVLTIIPSLCAFVSFLFIFSL